MIIIVEKNPLLENWYKFRGAYSGFENRLATLYPDNNELQNLFEELLLPDNEEILNYKENYRLFNNKVCLKPLVELSLSQNQIQLGQEINLTISLSDLQPEDIINNIDFYYNDILDNEELINNTTIIPLQFNVPGKYKFKVNSDLFRFNPITLEVI